MFLLFFWFLTPPNSAGTVHLLQSVCEGWVKGWGVWRELQRAKFERSHMAPMPGGQRTSAVHLLVTGDSWDKAPHSKPSKCSLTFKKKKSLETKGSIHQNHNKMTLSICPVQDDWWGDGAGCCCFCPAGLGELKITPDTLHLPHSEEDPPGRRTH